MSARLRRVGGFHSTEEYRFNQPCNCTVLICMLLHANCTRWKHLYLSTSAWVGSVLAPSNETEDWVLACDTFRIPCFFCKGNGSRLESIVITKERLKTTLRCRACEWIPTTTFALQTGSFKFSSSRRHSYVAKNTQKVSVCTLSHLAFPLLYSS